MHRKLAGHIPLQEMIESTLESARSKVASAEKKAAPAKPAGQEKTASDKGTVLIDPHNPDEIEKLASALEIASEKVAHDQVYLGGESPQGGEVLVVKGVTPGKQMYKKDSSKAHNVPMSTGLTSTKDNPGASTAVPTNEGKAPGGAPMPKKGVFKTAADSVRERIFAANAAKVQAAQDPNKPGAEKPDLGAPGKKKNDDEEKSKESEAPLDYLLGKLAESAQGGETLDSPSGQGPKPPSGSKGGNSARSALESNAAAINLKKVDAKAPQRKMLSEVLSEPALSKAHDSKVHENLRNASKGGVKIAAATAFLQKIASDPTDPRHALLMTAIEKKKTEKDERDKSTDEAPPAAQAGTSTTVARV